jgi:sec-independent protein translocase protein TatA
LLSNLTQSALGDHRILAITELRFKLNNSQRSSAKTIAHDPHRQLSGAARMLNLGWPEVLIILGVAVLIFGPKKFPELGSTFGKTLRGFKEGMTQAQTDKSPEDPD